MKKQTEIRHPNLGGGTGKSNKNVVREERVGHGEGMTIRRTTKAAYNPGNQYFITLRIGGKREDGKKKKRRTTHKKWKFTSEKGERRQNVYSGEN